MNYTPHSSGSNSATSYPNNTSEEPTTEISKHYPSFESSETSKNRSLTNDLLRLRPALVYLKPYIWRTITASIALIATAALTLSLGQGLRLLVDDGLAAASVTQLHRIVAIFLILIILLSIGIFTRYYLVSWLGERISADLRKKVFNHILCLHPGFFDHNRSGEIQSRITTDTSLLQTVIGSSVSIALRNLLLLVGGTVLLVVTNFRLAAVALISVPLTVVPILFFGRRVKKLSRSSQDRIADLGSYVGETLRGFKTMLSFNQQHATSSSFNNHVENAFNTAVRMIKQRALLTAVVILLVTSALAAMLLLGGYDVINGNMSAGELSAFLFYAFIVVGAVGAIGDVIGDLHRAAGAASRLIELLAVKPLIEAPAKPLPLPHPVNGSIQIQGLAFAYLDREQTPALKDINLTVPAGHSLALVGPSGAGKSTLFNLILRFYNYQHGHILFDNVEIAHLDPSVLRQQIAYVAQDAVLFSGSLKDNILYGNPNATDEALMAAISAAYIDEFLPLLPKGMDSEIGEHGVRLSGGQQQRVAIARAILRNAPLLLLDEATSSLDASSERKIQDSLQKLMRERTSLVIAHRLATVINIDKIAVLEQGKIVAVGTHNELLEQSPSYLSWVELQSLTSHHKN